MFDCNGDKAYRKLESPPDVPGRVVIDIMSSSHQVHCTWLSGISACHCLHARKRGVRTQVELVLEPQISSASEPLCRLLGKQDEVIKDQHSHFGRTPKHAIR